MSPSAVRDVHAVLAGAFKQAQVWGWIDRNPMTLVTRPAVRRLDVQPLSWLLLAASVALSTLLQVAVAPPTLVGYLTDLAAGQLRGAQPAYRADTSATQAPAAAEVSAERSPVSAEAPQPGAEMLTKRAQAERIYAALSADGAPISAGQLAAAAGLSASYARALIAQFQSRLPAAVEQNGHRPAPADPEAGP